MGEETCDAMTKKETGGGGLVRERMHLHTSEESGKSSQFSHYIVSEFYFEIVTSAPPSSAQTMSRDLSAWLIQDSTQEGYTCLVAGLLAKLEEVEVYQVHEDFYLTTTAAASAAANSSSPN